MIYTYKRNFQQKIFFIICLTFIIYSLMSLLFTKNVYAEDTEYYDIITQVVVYDSDNIDVKKLESLLNEYNYEKLEHFHNWLYDKYFVTRELEFSSDVYAKLSVYISQEKRECSVDESQKNGTGQSNDILCQMEKDDILEWLNKYDTLYLSDEVKQVWKDELNKYNRSGSEEIKNALRLLDGESYYDVYCGYADIDTSDDYNTNNEIDYDTKFDVSGRMIVDLFRKFKK